MMARLITTPATSARPANETANDATTHTPTARPPATSHSSCCRTSPPDRRHARTRPTTDPTTQRPTAETETNATADATSPSLPGSAQGLTTAWYGASRWTGRRSAATWYVAPATSVAVGSR